MTEKVYRLMNDSPAIRWTVLVLIALAMFFGYMFVDVMSPLKTLVESQRGWDSGVFGTYAASELILNVCGFLILAGIILDKMGIRFTGILSTALMVIGAAIKWIGVSEWFQGTAFNEWLNSWWVVMPGSAKIACLGFMIFGCGCEMAGTTVSKTIAKWFKGKEMALAMGMEMAIARLGVFAVMWIAPIVAEKFNGVPSAVGFCGALLCIGLINFIIFAFMDVRFDKQLTHAGLATSEKDPEEEFRLSDLGKIFSSKMFWIVALLCVLYYSAIFPFQRYAPEYLDKTLGLMENGVSTGAGARLFSCFPILAMILTPVLGGLLDKKGKGATMLLIGSVVMFVCHLCFAFLLPAFPSKGLALVIIVVLGVSFSLVPAALWPSVPKIIDEKILGSAYSLIFWVQNLGLCFVPLIIGKVLQSTGGYTWPMIIFSCFGVLAFLFGIALKREDKKKGYGLELPNIKEKEEGEGK
ncbi:MAG: MFS transporter [Bacteroidales bacterium]|nr:MFS transporter [Bacteroidales bacterium]